MRTFTMRESGFSFIELAIGSIVLILLGAVGWLAYIHFVVNPAESTTTTAGPVTWKTGTLKYEKATFSYPSNWHLSDSSTPGVINYVPNPGTDDAELTSQTGLTVEIDTGDTTRGGDETPYGGTVISIAPISTLGGSYYLGFGTKNGVGLDQSTDSTSESYGPCVGDTADSSANYIPSKYIAMSNYKTFNLICIRSIVMANSTAGPPGPVQQPKTVSAFKNDPSYQDAVRIIESLTYMK